jgi:hypothetical protein
VHSIVIEADFDANHGIGLLVTKFRQPVAWIWEARILVEMLMTGPWKPFLYMSDYGAMEARSGGPAQASPITSQREARAKGILLRLAAGRSPVSR